MGIQIDLIIPPVIVGLLVIVIFRLNAFIMETSIDNRLNNDMQMFADVTSRIIQEEVKTAGEIVRPVHPDNPDSVLIFVVESLGDTVRIQRSERNFEVIRKSGFSPSIPDTVIYPSSLSSLEFDLERKPVGEPTPYYLNFRIETESNPDHHATLRGEPEPVRAFSESEVYLRNIHRKSL